MKINFKGVSAQTWIRTAILIIALINQAVVMIGMYDKNIDVDTFTARVSYILTALSSLWSWWKNNSFTQPAQCADRDYDIK
ncbi:MAG: phage holin [Ruminococcus sp.]|nr:phage holin [Candidatus Copronaster equi]